MRSQRIPQLALAPLGALLLGSSPAAAIVHLWDVAEIYSNEDGSVQFVELFTKGAFETFTSTGRLRSDTSSVDLLADVDFPSTDRSYLLATPGFAELPGAVTPDTVMAEAPFFAIEGDTIVFTNINDSEDFDTIDFGPGELPIDGVDSLHRENPGGTAPADAPGGLFVAANSPTNYAGETGHLLLPEPAASALGPAALLALATVRARRR